MSKCGEEREQEMDSSLWSLLPQELRERVLAFLPFPSIFQLRSVCKRWLSLIYSPEFLHTRAGIPNSSWATYFPVCYINESKSRADFQWSVFDFEAHKWQMMPALSTTQTLVGQASVPSSNWLLGSSTHGYCNHESVSPIPGKKHLVVGGGSFLCFCYVQDLYDTQFDIGALCLVNPLTKEWKQLPPMHQLWGWPDVRHLIVNKSDNSYKIILAGNQRFKYVHEVYRSTEVYDSASDSWTVTGRLPSHLYFGYMIGAPCNGMLYCAARRHQRYAYDVLVAYDINQGVWNEVPHTFPAGLHQGTFHIVLAHQDRILMVVEHTKDDGDCTLGIFELGPGSKVWKELVRMPHDMFLEFGALDTCVANGDRVCMVGYKQGNCLVLVYDLCKKTWLWLPSCPLSKSKHANHGRFFFEPNLNAMLKAP